MNKIFKVVWSKVRNCYVVVSEIAKNTVSGVGKRNRIGKVSLAATLAASVLTSGFFMPNEVWAESISVAQEENYIAIKAVLPKYDWGVYTPGNLTQDQVDEYNQYKNQNSNQKVYRDNSGGDSNINTTYYLVSANNEWYWVQDGYTIKTTGTTPVLTADAGTTVLVSNIVGEAINPNFKPISTIQVHEDSTTIKTVVNDNLDKVSLNPYGSASNSRTVTVQDNHTYVLNRGTREMVVVRNNNQQYTNPATNQTAYSIDFDEAFVSVSTSQNPTKLTYDEISKSYYYDGHHVHNNSVYYIGDSDAANYRAGVFVINGQVYDGTVYGNNGETLLTGQVRNDDNTTSLITYWGAAIENYNMTIADSGMTLGNLREGFDILKRNDDELADADIKSISIDETTNGGSISLNYKKANETVNGTINIVSGGGKLETVGGIEDYIDTYVTISNVVDGTTHTIKLDTGSKVVANPEFDDSDPELNAISINGEIFRVKNATSSVGSTNVHITDKGRKSTIDNTHHGWQIEDNNNQQGLVFKDTTLYGVTSSNIVDNEFGKKYVITDTAGTEIEINDVASAGYVKEQVSKINQNLTEVSGKSIKRIKLDPANKSLSILREGANGADGDPIDGTVKFYSYGGQKVGDAYVDTYIELVNDEGDGTANNKVVFSLPTGSRVVANNGNGGTVLSKLSVNGQEFDVVGTDYRLIPGTDSISNNEDGYVVDADGTVDLKVQNGDDVANAQTVTIGGIARKSDLVEVTERVSIHETNISNINNSITTLTGNDIESIKVISGENSGRIDLLRTSKTGGANDVVPGGLSFTSSVDNKGNRVITISGAGNNEITLDAGSVVSANEGEPWTLGASLKDITINGQKYSVATSDSVTSAAAAAKTVVLAGKNVDVETVVKNANGEDGHTEYTVNAKKTIVNGDSNVVVGTPIEDTNNHTITYDLRLADTVTIGSGVANKVTIDGTNGTVTGLNNITWNAESIVSGRAATEDQLKAVWDDTVVGGSVDHSTGNIELKSNDGGTVEVGKLRDYAIQDEDVVVTDDKATLNVKDRYSNDSYSVDITGIASTSALESAKTQINNQITNITNGSAIKFNTIGNDKLGLVNASGGTLSSVTITSQVGTGGLVGVVNGAKDATITFTGTDASNPVVVTVGSTVSGTLNNGVLTAIRINGENYDLFTASEQNLSVSGSTHGWVLTDSSDTDGDNVHYDTTLNSSTTKTSGDANTGYSFTVADTAGTSITVNDIASASNLNSLKTVVDGHTTNIADLSSSINTINSTVANNYSTLSGNDIERMVVTPNSGTGGTVALLRNSTTGTTDTVPGTLTFTSGGGTEATGDTYVHISGEGVNGNVQGILLHTGTKVEANSKTADDSTMTQLTLLTVNGKDYFIPEMDVDQNGNAVFQDYHVTNGNATLYTYNDSDNITVAVKGYSVDAEHGVVELHVHDRHQNTGSHEGIVRIGNLANKTTQDAHTKQLTGTVMYDVQGEGYNYNSIKLGETDDVNNYQGKQGGGVKVTNVAYAEATVGATGYDGSAAVNVDLLNDKISAVQTIAEKQTTLSDGKNIDVDSSTNNGVTNYTVNLKDNITLGATDSTNVNINGNAGTITATTKDGNNNTTGQVTIDSANNKITVGVGGSNNNQVVINGGTGTITGLSNTTWDGTNVVADRAATEGQLQAAISNIQTTVNNTNITGGAINTNGTITLTKGNGSVTLTGKLSDNSLVAGTYGIDSSNNVVLNIRDKYDTNAVTTATIQDVAKASELGDVDSLRDDLKDANSTNSVVNAVNRLDDKVNQGWTSKVNGTDVQNIKMGGSQNFVDGTNIKLTAGENNSIKVSTATDVKFEKVTVGDVVMDSDGINAGNKKITNVAAGTEDNDAVNVKQLKEVNANASAHANFNTQHIENLYGQDQYLDSRINQVNSRVNKVGAGAAALAALHPMDFDPDDKLSFAVGAGNYAGENATALGAFYRPNEKVMMSVGGTYGNGENMVNVGMSFALDRTNNVSNSRTAMAKEIVDLREQVATQGQQIAQLVALVQQLAGTTQPIVPAEQLFPDVPQNHWAYEYVNGLIAKGIIEGYPDGTFGGDRAMTRYEFAAMLFRAMEQGVVINEQVRQEFEKELGRIRVDRVKGTDADLNKIERVRVNTAIDRDDYGSKVVQVKH